MNDNKRWVLQNPDSVYYCMFDAIQATQGQRAAEVYATTSCHITALRVLADLGLELDAARAGPPAVDGAPVVLALGGDTEEGFDQHDHVLVLAGGESVQSFFRLWAERRWPTDAALVARAAEHDAQCALLGVAADVWPAALAVSHYTTRPVT